MTTATTIHWFKGLNWRGAPGGSQFLCSALGHPMLDYGLTLLRGVQRHSGDAKCVTEILGPGTKIRKLGGNN